MGDEKTISLSTGKRHLRDRRGENAVEIPLFPSMMLSW